MASCVALKQHRLSVTNRQILSLALWFLLLTFSLDSSCQEVSSKPSSTCIGLRISCPDPNSICFPSTKPNLVDLPVSPQTGNAQSGQSLSFSLSIGGAVACSSVVPRIGVLDTGLGKDHRISCEAPLIPYTWMKASIGVISDFDKVTKDDEAGRTGQLSTFSSTLHVHINPPVLDWGNISVYSSSLKNLNIKNMFKEMVFEIYEPSTSNPQFYAHGFEGIVLKPGQNISISFVFLPRTIASNLAHIVIETSMGGFIVRVRGSAIESPYKIKPLIGLEMEINGVLSTNLSIYNHNHRAIRVEEVAISMAASSSVNESNHAICKLNNQLDNRTLSSHSHDWFSLTNNQFGFVKMDLKPGKKWKVMPYSDGRIVDLELQGKMEGKVFGAICLKLRNGTAKKASTLVVPFGLEVHRNPNYNNANSLFVKFYRHQACGLGNGMIFSLYLRNEALELLTLLNIFEEREGGEKEKVFEIQYVKNLILFRESNTMIGFIAILNNSFSKNNSIELGKCNLVIETNLTLNPLVKIPCRHFLGSEFRLEKYQLKGLIANNKSSGGILEQIEGSDVIISNWISHGKKPEYSVLTMEELIFPPVLVGSQSFECILVNNKSPHPIIVQLILNSEQIISDCKSEDESSDHIHTSRSSEMNFNESRFGFSIPDTGLTMATLKPNRSTWLGPVVFHPSQRCNWSSSALIRSNLSGVEQVFLKGTGVSSAIALVEGSEPVRRLEFNPNLSIDIKSSLSSSCPLCICEFSEKCEGFVLFPGETVVIETSYRPDLRGGTNVQQDLKMVMHGDVFLKPMKVTNPMKVTVPSSVTSQWDNYLLACYWISVTCFSLGLIGLFFVWLIDVVDKNNKNNGKRSEKQPLLSRGKKSVNKGTNKASGQRSGQSSQNKKTKAFIDPFISKRVGPDAPTKPAKAVNTDQNGPKPADLDPPTKSAPPLNRGKEPVSVEPPQADLTFKVVGENKSKRKNRRRFNNTDKSAPKMEASSSQGSNSIPNSPVSSLSSTGSTPNEPAPIRRSSNNSSTHVSNNGKEKEKEKAKETKKSIAIPTYSPLTSATFADPWIYPNYSDRAVGRAKKEEIAEKVEMLDGSVISTFEYNLWRGCLGCWHNVGKDQPFSFFLTEIRTPPPKVVVEGTATSSTTL